MDYQELFNYMRDEHDVILLDTDLHDIVTIVNKMQEDDVKIIIGKVLTYSMFTHSNRSHLKLEVFGEENYIGNTLKSGDYVEIRHYK